MVQVIDACGTAREARRGQRPRLIRPARWPERTLLGVLAEDTRDTLLAMGRYREYASGSTLIMEGDTSTDVLLLIDGWVKVVAVTQDGGQALLSLRVGGDIVGEQAALDGLPRSASVISAGATVACVIKQDSFLQFVVTRPDFALALNRAISAKLRWDTRRRVDFGGLPVRTRLARLLSELAELSCRATSDGIDLGYELTQPELAAMVGASDPAVHRALRELRAAGVVTTGYRRVTIVDLPALEAIASSADAAG